MQRRHLLASTALLVTPSIARAQAGFDHALRIIVPNAPGGTSDILARLIAGPLGRSIGQNVVVENRAGAGGNVGADVVAKSPPDGHTLLLLDVSVLAANPFLFARLPFDVQRDLAPVSMLIYAPYILGVNNNLPVRSAAELAAYAKANPGRLNAANSGIGTLTHIAALALAAHWGTEMTSVSYRGGAPALLAMASNEANLTMAGMTQSLPFVQNGQMRGIAVSGPRRLTQLPELPTFRELGWPHPDAGTWQGILTRGGTPPAMIARLNEEIAKVVQDPVVKERIATLGGEPKTDGPEAFRTWLAAETETYGRIIRQHNIRLDE